MRPAEFCHRLASGWRRSPLGGSLTNEGQGHDARLETERANSTLGNDDFVLHLKSLPSSLGVARQAAKAACSCIPLSPQEAYDFVLAVNEAVANAMKHGSPNGPDDFVTVRCAVTDRAIRVSVSDHGAGFGRRVSKSSVNADALPLHGFGLPIMRRLSDGLKIRSCSHGTTVTMAKFFSPLAKAA